MTEKVKKDDAKREAEEAFLSQLQQALPPPDDDGSQVPSDVVPRRSGPARPPPKFASQGSFSGWIWTIPCTLWERSRCLVQFPPPVTGNMAPQGIERWFAVLNSNTLVLRPEGRRRPQQQGNASKNGKVQSAVEIALDGCSVTLVRDGLGPKTPWYKKGPLELAHPSQELLAGL